MFSMKKKSGIVVGLIILIVIILWISFIAFTRSSRDWTFIQTVGGIKIEKPLETEDGFYLPIICNVSGQDSVTVKPKGINSALFCLKTKTTIKENIIYLTVITGYALFEKPDSKCKAVRIGKLKSGNYKVFYKDIENGEHIIGEFTIE